MLRVRVIKKFHDDKGILIGYTVQNEDNPCEKRNMHKDILKNAVINKQCEVVNMTLTSDGRLIGKAAPKREKKSIQRLKLLEVYTNGKNIVGGLVTLCDNTQEQYVETGSIINLTIKNGLYSNVTVSDSKSGISMDDVKKKSFKTVKSKLLKMLENSNIQLDIIVEKGNNKSEYVIYIKNSNSIGVKAAKVIQSLIEDAMATEKIKVIQSIDSTSVIVQCYTGIADVRKAIKQINKVK